ncbi:MAG: protein kinase [Acidobacteriia bacterium]|nr:protein kinase [Terriglobia bacterium]
MILKSGEQLGPYRVLEPIGAGGMGEVYRAHDPRLNRDVAIKVSSERFSERFSREAHAVAALNHPSICHLYDVGPNYLVMELVEGPTLAERIKEGALPLDEALPIARQIADALDAAHEKGIVHRDLKPGNVKIKPDGTVKVLDFGLAKTGGIAAVQSEHSPTLTVGAATEAGVILGTAAYMAPEQAKGKTVDKRADIWAFGVVLYEMVTGKRLFHGETITEVLASVLKEEPKWDKVPPQVQRLLKKCLEKDPQQRLRHIGDVMQLVDDSPAMAQTAPPAQKRSWLWPSVTAVLLVAVAGLGYLYVRGRTSATSDVQTRFQIPAPENNNVIPFSVSPDGRRLVFSATEPGKTFSQLSIRTLDSLESHLLPDTEGGGFTFWSPDSKFVVFVSHRKLKKIDISGGPAQTICDLPAGAFRGGSWNREGEIVFGTQNQALWRVSSGGGNPLPITALDLSRHESSHLFPSFLPDGRHFIYLAASSDPGNRAVYVASLDAKPQEQHAKRLLSTATNAVFAPSLSAGKDQLLFLRDGSVLAQTLDTGHLELAGDPIPIAERVGAAGLGTSGSSYGFFAASASGVLVYRGGGSGGADEISQLTWYGRDGRMLGTAGDPGPYTNLLLSPDATRAAVVEAGDLWVMDLSRGTSNRLTTARALVTSSGVWSPDGSHIAYTANPGGVLGIYQIASSGAGTEELLWKEEGLLGPTHWSSDGRFLLFGLNDPKTAFDVWALPMKGDGKAERKPVVFVHTEFTELGGRFSPDRRWAAYISNRSGRNEIYVQPFNAEAGAGASGGAPAGEFLVSKGGATGMPRWRSDGKEIYYLTNDGKVMAVEVSTSPSFHAGEPKMLFQTPPTFVRGNTPGSMGDVAADGKRFLLAMPIARPTSQEQFTAVLNWTAALKK